MEKHRCKICNRRFANGKAMGGHMRSHLAKLPITPKLHRQPPPQSSSSSLEPKYQNPRNREFSFSGSDVHDGDTESSPKNFTRRRSKRRRKSAVTVPLPESPPEQEPVSSVISETTFSLEDVAMCLLMLSQDNRTKTKAFVDKSAAEDENRSIYRCETCKKAFRSYQALGGHRASHKKGNGENCVTDQRIFECSFCFKVFESGQALGGHKKVHLSNQFNARNCAKFGDNMIDLNLPAPEEDDEGSQVEFSVVSSAEVFHPNR